MRKLEEYLNSKHDVKKQPKENYRITIKSFEDCLHTIEPQQEFEDVYLDSIKVNTALNLLSEQIEDSSWNLRLSLMKCYVRWLYGNEEDELPKVWRSIKPKKIDWEEKLKDKWLTEQEFLDLLNATELMCFRAAWATGQSGALRRGELASLKVGNAEVLGDEIKVTVSGKTGTRSFVMNQFAPILRHWLNFHPFKDDPNAPLWIKRRNSHGGLYKGIGARSLDKIFKKYTERAGIARWKTKIDQKTGEEKKVNVVSLHWLRHTKVTWTARNRKIRVNDKQANAMFGWSPDSEMYKRYTHLAGTDTDDAFRLLEGVEAKHDDAVQKNVLARVACFNCNEQNSAGSLYCVSCGFPLNADAAQRLLDRKMMEEDLRKMQAELNKLMQEYIAKKAERKDSL